MTATSLKAHTLKDLVQLAKKHGINGWHSMRKDQLVQALVRSTKPQAPARKGSKRIGVIKLAPAGRRTGSNHKLPPVAAKRTGLGMKRVVNGKPPLGLKPTNGKLPATNHAPIVGPPLSDVARRNPRLIKRLEQAKARLGRCKDLTSENNGQVVAQRDRLVAMVRGPFWLHACWELTAQAVTRAKAAMGQEWHAAKPVLRVLGVSTTGSTTSSERVLRDIEIHGGVTDWYVDVKDPPQTYRLEVGYLAASHKFYSLARSNVVTTPSAGSADAVDSHWTEVALDSDKIYAMSGGFSADTASSELQELFEERLRRPMGSPIVSRYGVGAQGMMPRDNEFEFVVDAEMIIYGATHPDAHVVLQGEPVRLRPDGSFTVRCSMPNRRQVVPIVASSRDGGEQRTIILAVERNTKVMEPLTRESGD